MHKIQVFNEKLTPKYYEYSPFPENNSDLSAATSVTLKKETNGNLCDILVYLFGLCSSTYRRI